MSKASSKVFIFGVDGLPPDLLFKKYIKQLPNFKKLIATGMHGNLRSTIPPYSTSAWTTFNSGYDPGTTGIHGFIARPDRNGLRVTNSKDVKVPRLWNILSSKNRKSIVLNVPLTYPASKINGIMVTDFLTPSFDGKSVYPKNVKQTIQKILKGKDYPFDIPILSEDTIDSDSVIKETYQMTDAHLKVAKYFFEKEQWDLFNFVIIGTDRLHHMFWKHIDPRHKHHDPKSKYKNVILDYYKYLDKHLGWFTNHPLVKNQYIIVASDHGMDKMDGQININDWLIREGFLKLNVSAEQLTSQSPQRFSLPMIDKMKTCAYASGGYCGRIFVIRRKVKTIREITKKLSGIHREDGRKIKVRVFKTKDLYKKFDPEAPELIVFFENLFYGVNTDVGNKSIFKESISEVDSAGHSMNGSYIISGPNIHKKRKNGEITQIAPTILKLMEIKDYQKMPAKPML